MFSNSTFIFNAKYSTYHVKLVRGWYGNGNNALQLIDAEDGSPIMIASVNTGDKLEADQIAIKDYSENEGVATFLSDIGFIDGIEFFKPMGYVKVPICHLSKEAQEFFK